MHACSVFVCLSVSRSPTKLLWTEKERHEKGMHCSFSIALFALIDYCPLQRRRHTIIYLVCAIYWRRSREGVFSCLFSACFLCRSIFFIPFFQCRFIHSFVQSFISFIFCCYKKANSQFFSCDAYKMPPPPSLVLSIGGVISSLY